ncbi:hypothetical protein [Microbacterium hydrocarbonoxydans]|uniref:hypothetical protein n=1 Tax=Microbacterium hydrocarbonoxydans TaxID=273678 RepID=UPI00203DDDBB|nr:hypothetical protein [Microbacterium hydrocarbonoxydans]MCM3780646.1 hypothetical protein [Microbacterium hydrocarbonoxydans]
MKIKSVLSTGVLAVVLASMMSPAHAEETPPGTPPEDVVEQTLVEPIDATLVIDGKPTDIAVMADFDPAAPALVFDESGEPVAVSDVELVYANGTNARVATVDPTNRAALAGCDWKSWVAPGTGTWYTSGLGCSFIGLNAATQVGYGWSVDSSSSGSACLNGRGYQYLSWPGGGGYSELYGGIGCGSGGDSGGDVLPWGNVASTKRIKMISYSTPAGAAGMWQ